MPTVGTGQTKMDESIRSAGQEESSPSVDEQSPSAGLCESLRSGGSDVTEFSSSTIGSSLCGTSEEFWRSKLLSDCILVARGGKVKAHRFVLWSHCLMLHDQLLSLSDQLQGEISLDVDISQLKLVMQFVYCGRAEVPETEIWGVAGVAKLLGVDDLNHQCTKKGLATRTIALDTCFEVWVKGTEVGAQDIAQKAKKFALENFVKLRRNPGFKALPFTLVKSYTTDRDLQVRNQDDRLMAALIWIKDNRKEREYRLLSFLDILPLSEMSKSYLDSLLDDDLVQNNDQARDRLDDLLENAVDYDKCKRDVEDDSQAPKQRYLLLVAPHDQFLESKGKDVVAVEVEKNFKPVILCSLPAIVQSRMSSCCIHGNMLYIAGLGELSEEIWKFDLKTLEPSRCGKLSTPRCGHAMVPVGRDQVYMIGGWLSSGAGYTSTVEAYNTTDGSVTKLGKIKHARCANLVGCAAGEHLLISGAFDEVGSVVQVYSVARRSVKQVVQLGEAVGNIWGAVVVKDHLVMVAEYHTVVCKVSDLCKGHSGNIRTCDKYGSPNLWCGVSLSKDNTKFYLLGGGWGSKYSVYQASVDDVIKNTGSGWKAVKKSEWSMGQALMYGGQAMADVHLDI